MTERRGYGEGGVRLRPDGRWEATVELGIADGKRKRKYVYGKTKREVMQKRSAVERAVADGTPVSPERLTVQKYLDQWLESVRPPKLRPSTWIRYEELLRLHIVPDLGATTLGKLTPQQVQRVIDRKLTAGLSPYTVRNARAVLRRALNQAVRWRTLSWNVVTVTDGPQLPQEEPAVLGAAEARRFLEVARGHPLEALFVLALTTALREGEILALRWSEVDLDARALKVIRNVRRIRGVGWHIGPPKTAHGRRPVQLTNLAVEELRRHRERQEALRRAAERWEDNDLVFCNTVGRHIEGSNLLQRQLYPLLERAGLPRVTFHGLRHTVASLLLEQGIHPKVVQEMLGHSHMSVTMDVYSHVAPTMHGDAVEALDTLLRSDAPPQGDSDQEATPDTRAKDSRLLSDE